MKLKLTHQFYKKPTPGSHYESRFFLSSEDSAIGQMMTEKQARSVFKNLGLDFPDESTHRQWTVEID